MAKLLFWMALVIQACDPGTWEVGAQKDVCSTVSLGFLWATEENENVTED